MACLIGDVALTNAEKSARYDKKNRMKRNAAARRRYVENPEKVYQSIDNWLKANPARRLIQVARRRAKLRGMRFELTEADLIPLPTHCPIFGVALVYNGKGFNANAASIDRKDNTKGYTKIISRRANIVKSSGTAAEHRKIADWMEAYHGT
jgi:hypothetical protein